MDGRAWQAAVHGVTKSWTRLSIFTFPFHFHELEKEMATHSRVLAWRIPGTVEPGSRLWGRTEADTTEATQQQQQDTISGLPRWHSGKESACQCRRCRRCRFHPWVRKIPWIRKRQPPPVFLAGKFHGQRSLVGYSPWGYKESDIAEHTHIYISNPLHILFPYRLLQGLE